MAYYNYYGKKQHNFCALVAVALLACAGSSFAQEKISMEDFKAGVDNGSFDLILDVRTQLEWDGGHIPGAIHVPIDTFSEDDFWTPMVQETTTSTSTTTTYSCNKSCATIVAYCSVGGRAGIAIDKLREMGFEGTLYNGQGTNQWVGTGYELVLLQTMGDDPSPPACVSTDICPTTETEEEEEIPLESSANNKNNVVVVSDVVGDVVTRLGAALVIPTLLVIL
jgi:phage shock protein E